MEFVTPPLSKSRQPRTGGALLRIGGLFFLIAAASLIGYRFGWFDYRHALEHVDQLRRSHTFVIFALVFVLIYGSGTAVGIPGLPFTVAAGALFGTLLGSVLSWVGAMISAVVGYWIARTVGHDVVARWLGRFKRVDAAIGEARDFVGMLRLRLIPVLPLGAVNFVAGLAKAPLVPYVAATAVGVIPSTIIYTYFADSLVEGVGHGYATALRSLVLASLLLIAITLAPKLLRPRQVSSSSPR